METDKSLELSVDALARLIDAAKERVLRHIESLPTQPSADAEGGAAFARSLVEPLPRTGKPYMELLDFLFDVVIPKSFNTAGPGYLAYIPGGGLPHSAVADLIADATNRYVGVFAAAPGLAQIEWNVVRWFCEIVGYPATAGGILTSGGSLSNLSALIAARRDRLPENFLSATIYVSDQTHHSIQKAAMLAGFPTQNVREVRSDNRFRVRVDDLERAIASDRRLGLTPFAVIGNAGTTNTGAVDDLGALADVAAKERLWFHVDGAYGGFFLLTERGRRRLAGIERADSIALDPHKGLFLPYGTGALLVRDFETLKKAHALSADYMPSMQEDRDLVDFNLLSPELSRDWRGLRAWLPIKMHGIEVFQKNLDEKLDLTLWAAEELKRIDGMQILAEPQLSIVAFRLTRPGLDEPALNALNRDLMNRVNAKKRVYLTGTLLNGRFAIRICVLSFRTHLDRMQEGLEDIRAAILEA
ncbi:MAG TPA: aminotransferase class I/II-fold pyridoxal phosphate-dependent enzyme [Thermoanaerobaculia bacterium]|nr:aminotransferase class I/II-fold pyridoxal phosphate-dependent enzyme [Thermoanaerobaculia bacterium]